MYDIIYNLIYGENVTVMAIAGVVVLVLFTELSVMVSKIFRFFMR